MTTAPLDGRASGGAAGPPTTEPTRLRRLVLLAASLACASCGLVYELGLVNLGTSLIGSSLRASSITIGTFVFAMGVGSVAAKSLVSRPLLGFVGIELALALVGGTSGLLLYLAYARYSVYDPALLGFAAVVGALIGAEIPLLMELLQRLRPASAATDAADLMAADYVGALLAGLAFPFLLVPRYGLVRSSIAAGVLNVACAAVVVAAADRRGRVRLQVAAACVVVAAILGLVAVRTEGWLVDARQRLYDDPIVDARRSAYQDLVLTRSTTGGDLRLFLDGDLQFSSIDEHRYHEALVHPILGTVPVGADVLILGGGDGLAAREVLAHPEVGSVTLVDLDPAVTDLAIEQPQLVALNGGSLTDPRVEVVHEDAMRWVDRTATTGEVDFDAVIVDLPDPDDLAIARLYSVEMYLGLAAVLAPGGTIVVQAGSPWFAREAFWCVAETLEAAGLATTAYQVDVPSFGNWGFVAAVPAAAGRPQLAVDPDVPTRFLTAEVLQAALVFPPDRDRLPVEPSTLDDPHIAGYTAKGWNQY